jgi:hypothetical protein
MLPDSRWEGPAGSHPDTVGYLTAFDRPRPPLRLLLRQAVQPGHITPFVLARRVRSVPLPPVTVLSVYRRRLAHVLHSELARMPYARQVLWALDEPADALAAHTVGSGPGTRTELLNRLWRHTAPTVSSDAIVVVMDDDVTMPPRHMSMFLRACVATGLDLAQPAHVPRSYTSWDFVRQRLFTFVRRTHFVEQGPIISLNERARNACLPLPEELGMGWGLEALWARAATSGLVLGIVDAASMRHLGTVSTAYHRSPQDDIGRKALQDAGFSSYAELQVVSARWQLGQATPEWVRA